MFWFDEVPDKALYEGKFEGPMLWNSNFFMTRVWPLLKTKGATKNETPKIAA